MDEKIKIGIVGYGNIGKAVEAAVAKNPDMSLEAIFSRRVSAGIQTISGTKVFNIDEAEKFKDLIDIVMLCGGSATDLPKQGPHFARLFNTVDSYDTHAKIPKYFDSIDEVAKEAGNTCIISVGWDPGTFSVERLYANTFLPGAKAQPFYGLTETGGLSMGHSDAIRRIEGVEDARQYTHAIQGAIEAIKNGADPNMELKDMVWRECIIVAKKGADKDKIAAEIKEMPYYFAPYRTEVKFVDKETLQKDYSGMPHDGIVVAVSETTPGNKGIIEYKCQWDSNPEATAQIMLPYGRAVHRLNKEGDVGAKTVFDIAPKYLSRMSNQELRKEML